MIPIVNQDEYLRYLIRLRRTLLLYIVTMSDIEDEMDVDVPSKSVPFTADGNAGKQKRVVADLPVDIGDSLPW